MTGEPARVAIVGGGVSGLAAAVHLRSAGLRVTILEASGRLGGTVDTERTDGFVMEGGPDSFLASKAAGVEWCRRLGVADRLVGTSASVRGAYVLSRGTLSRLPEGMSGLVPARLAPFARSPLISPWGKLRAALDLALPARAGDKDESVESFVVRRLGREVYGRLVEPLLSGIYAGDGARLSLAATFPHLRAAEREHGSLIRAMRAAKRGAHGGASARPEHEPRGGAPSGFLTFPTGMAELVEAAEAVLRHASRERADGQPAVEVRLRARVVRVECARGGGAGDTVHAREEGTDAPTAGGPPPRFHVTASSADGRHHFAAPGTTPAHAAPTAAGAPPHFHDTASSAIDRHHSPAPPTIPPHAAGAGFVLKLADGGVVRADAVVIATPAHVAAALLSNVERNTAAALAEIEHASVATISLAYALAAVPRPLDATGYVVPRVEGRPILACTWSSAKFANRAPAGFALFRLFVGGVGGEARVARSDAELLALAREELRAVMGIADAPIRSRLVRWEHATPQYNLGHLERVARIERGLASMPGLALAGNAYGGVGIPDCIRSGERAAERVVAHLRDRGLTPGRAPALA